MFFPTFTVVIATNHVQPIVETTRAIYKMEFVPSVNQAGLGQRVTQVNSCYHVIIPFVYYSVYSIIAILKLPMHANCIKFKFNLQNVVMGGMVKSVNSNVLNTVETTPFVTT